MRIKSRLLINCIFVVAAGLATTGRTQEPYAKIQFSSINRAKQVSSTLAEHGVGVGFDRQIDTWIESAGDTIDQDRQLAIFIVQSGPATDFVFCIPVTDARRLSDTLDRMGATTEALDGGLIRATIGRDFYLRPANGWCFVASSIEHLNSLPAVPTSLFRPGTTSEAPTADVSIDINFRAIPFAQRSYTLQRIVGWFADEPYSENAYRILPGFSISGLAIREFARAAASSDQLTATLSLTDSLDVECDVLFRGREVKQMFLANSELSQFHLPYASSSGTYRTQLSDEQLAWIHHWSSLVQDGLGEGVETISVDRTGDKELMLGLFAESLETLNDITISGNLDIAFVHTEDVVAYGIHVQDASVLLDKIVSMATRVQSAGGPVRDVKTRHESGGSMQAHTFSVPASVFGAPRNNRSDETWVDVAVSANERGLWIAKGVDAPTLLASIAENDEGSITPIAGRFNFASGGEEFEGIKINSEQTASGLEVSVQVDGGVLGQWLAAPQASTLTMK